MRISIWKCPHCNMTYENDEDYKTHLENVTNTSIDTLNTIIPDLREFGMSVDTYFDDWNNRRRVILCEKAKMQ